MIKIRRLGSTDINGCSGSFSAWTNTIKLANEPDLDPQEVQIAFLHEILESINSQFELRLPHPTLETLSSALYQVLKDNKLHFDGTDV